MAKDPALLLYTKDWIEGTGEMSPSEKGVYIDLLAHQHQKGDLPSDTSRLCRLVSLSENDFLPIWETVHKKFELKENGRLHNRRLTETVAKRSTKRSTKSHTNSITGRFAVLIRSVEPNFRDEIKKRFKIDDFNHFSTETATERLTEWFAERLTELENATILINNNSIVDSNKEGINNLGKENFEKEIVHVKSKKNFPVYSDFNGLPELNVNTSIELIRITQNATVSKSDIDSLWNVFKVQNLTGEKYYHSEKEVYSHFTNWVKNQKIQVENILKTNKNEKLGTSTARMEKIRTMLGQH